MSSKRLSAKDQVLRNQLIVADRARGYQWATIADRHNIGIRQAQKVCAEHRSLSEPEEDDYAEELKDEIVFLDAAIEECAEIAATTQNESVHLGAVKSRVDFQERRIRLKQACGLLPSQLRDIETLTAAWRLWIVFRQDVRALGFDVSMAQLDRFFDHWWRLFVGKKTSRAEQELEQAKHEEFLEEERAHLWERRQAELEEVREHERLSKEAAAARAQQLRADD